MTHLQVRLYRDSFSTPWGFRLQGGKDVGQALSIQRVFSNSPAEGELQRGDLVLSFGGRPGHELTHQQAQDIAKRGGGQIDIVISRPAPSRVSTTATFTPAPQRPRATSVQQPPTPRTPTSTMPVSGGGFSPRKVTLSRLGGGGPDFGSDFTAKYRSSSSFMQPVHVQTGGRHPDMLSRVHDSLDSATMSPRTPEFGYQAPPFSGGYMPTGVRLDMEREQEQQREQELRQQQQQQQQQQPQAYQAAPQQYYFEPQQPYMATGVRLDHQMGEEEQQEQVLPVSMRRKTFIDTPKPAPARTGKANAPKVLRPKSGGSSGYTFGTDYSKPATKTSSITFKPQSMQRPVNVPPPQHVPVQKSYAPPPPPVPKPAARPHVAPPPPAPQPPPAPWSNQQDEVDQPDVPPAWRTSLKTTGVKPWDNDMEYTSPQHVPSPRSQVQNPEKAGDRDWTQSAVYRMIYEEERRGPPPQQQQPKPAAAPPVAAKPQTQTFQQAFSPMEGEYGTSDF